MNRNEEIQCGTAWPMVMSRCTSRVDLLPVEIGRHERDGVIHIHSRSLTARFHARLSACIRGQNYAPAADSFSLSQLSNVLPASASLRSRADGAHRSDPWRFSNSSTFARTFLSPTVSA